MDGSEHELEEYEEILEIEEMESLLEDLEEGGWDADLNTPLMPPEIKERLEKAHVRDMTELRQKIASMHAALDTENGA